MAVLYRKYRPQVFAEIIGQDLIVEPLKKEIANGSAPHAFLFVGPKGSGKTTTARILAKALNCPNLTNGDPCGKCEVCLEIASGAAVDVIEIDGASNRKIDDIREIRDKIALSPSKLTKKVYIIDEVHMLTKEAFNALLKTLEEPPAHAVFVLCTTEADKVPATIVSRCQRFDFSLGRLEDVYRYLVEILKKEKVDFDEDAVTVIAQYANGGFRDALSMLGQVASYEKITIDLVERTLGRGRVGIADIFIEALLTQNRKLAADTLSELSKTGFDGLEFVRQCLVAVKDMLLKKIMGEQITIKVSKGELIEIYNSLDKAYQRLKYSPVVELPILLVVAEIIGVEENEPKPPTRVGSRKPDAKAAEKLADLEEEEATVVTRKTVKKKQTQETQAVAATDPIETEISDEAGAETVRDELQTVFNNWKAILENIRTKNSHVMAILRGGKPIAFDGAKVTIEVYFRFHQDKLREAKVLSLVESSMSEVLGKKVYLIIVLGKKEITATSDLSVENLVEAATEIFGGTSN